MLLKLLAGPCELSWEVRFFLSWLFLLGDRFSLLLGFLFIVLGRAHLEMVISRKPRILIGASQIDIVSQLLAVPFRLRYKMH